MIFKDAQHAWNPSQQEIRAWAYSSEKIPEQDWELAVNSNDNIPMICELIEDEKCKHLSFFLSSLYVFTGDIVKTGKKEAVMNLVVLLERVKKTAKSLRLIDWIERSEHLINNPTEYEYKYWGLGSKYVY